ncbi:hypothetical protein AUK10_02200 [Candidatus Gracilibacteria bacterium CG2_30_37_12]|nr:MAG: hypothetical protein AUK10_02200 [Candidatus Gracilibacteria bacterium CG2_30_37_12]
MKSFLSFFILTFLGFSYTSISADFFDQQIMMNDPEITLIQEITLNYVSFNNYQENIRYNNTSYFLTSIKNEAIARFQDGTIPYYRRYDIITHLESFIYDMNQSFLYQKRYEQTGKAIYKENAQGYLSDAKGAYSRLKDTLSKKLSSFGTTG